MLRKKIRSEARSQLLRQHVECVCHVGNSPRNHFAAPLKKKIQKTCFSATSEKAFARSLLLPTPGVRSDAAGCYSYVHELLPALSHPVGCGRVAPLRITVRQTPIFQGRPTLDTCNSFSNRVVPIILAHFSTRGDMENTRERLETTRATEMAPPRKKCQKTPFSHFSGTY